MIQQIKKRTGDIVTFNAQKIIDANMIAIQRAYDEVK